MVGALGASVSATRGDTSYFGSVACQFESSVTLLANKTAPFGFVLTGKIVLRA